MRIVAEFRESIAPAILKIITLLSDEQVNVRCQAVDSLGTFSKQGKIFNLVMRHD